MILNFDRGYGQSAEQMVQSLMESTQMAFDTLERKLGLPGDSLTDDDGNIITDKIEANNVITDKIEANNLAVKGELALGTALSIANGGTGATTMLGGNNPHYKVVSAKGSNVTVSANASVQLTEAQAPYPTIPNGYQVLFSVLYIFNSPYVRAANPIMVGGMPSRWIYNARSSAANIIPTVYAVCVKV